VLYFAAVIKAEESLMMTSNILSVASRNNLDSLEHDAVAANEILLSLVSKVNVGDKREDQHLSAMLVGQLAISARYSSQKNHMLSFSELSDRAQAGISRFSGPVYQLNKARADSELPRDAQPEHLARATMATTFVNGRFRNNIGSAPNPFAGLSAQQLAMIAHDESGTFTVNESRAAALESYRREEIWRLRLVAEMLEESRSTGKISQSLKKVLAHFGALPKMEQVQYPENYARDLMAKIDLDFNYKNETSMATVAMELQSVLYQKFNSFSPIRPEERIR
jgi:hypothetical protein